MASVRFHFDFISPYSYLASQLVGRDDAYAHIDLAYRPVVFGSMLSRLGTKGPGEIPNRRKHQLMDVLLLARHHGITLEGPPTHPFNSIYALRSVCAVEDEAVRGRLTRRYFRAAWADGESLEDLDVLARCLADVGVEQDPEAAATDRQNRATLKANTKELLAIGGWGVPSFVVDDLIFFGHDRLPLLEAYLERRDAPAGKRDELLARPQPGRIV